MQKYFILIFCFLTIQILANSQGLIVLDELRNSQITIQYNENQNDSSFSNAVIQDIAKGLQKNKLLVKFELNYHWHIRLSKISSTEYNLTIKLDSLNLQGDNLYKAFSILEIIKPYNLYVDLRLNDLNSIQYMDFNQQLDGSKKEIFTQILVPDTSKQAFWKLSKFEVKYNFSPIQKNEFQSFISQTDTYFEAYKKLNDLDAQLKSFDLNNINMIPLYNVDLRDMEKEIQELVPDKKVNLLSLSTKDPNNYLLKYDSISSQIQKLRKSFNTLVSSMDLEYLNKGKSLELQGNKSEAFKYYKKSIAVNPNFCPAYLSLSKWYLSNDSMYQSCSTLQQLLDSLKPDFETKNNAMIFAGDLLDKICSNGEELNKKEQFLEAITIYDAGIWFCKNTKGYSCSERMLKGMKQSKYGLYNSYLVIAKKAFDKKKYEMVEEYLKYASDYQKLNLSEIPEVPEIDKMYVQLANLSLLKAQKQLEQKEYSDAIIELDHTEKIALNQQNQDERLKQDIFEMRKIAHQGVFDEMLAQSKERKNNGESMISNELKLKKADEYRYNNQKFVSENSKTDSTKYKLKRSMYRHHIESGLGFMESANYSMALEAFNNAKSIEKEFPSFADPNLILYMGKCIKPGLIEKIKDGKFKAWASNFEEATQIYRSAQAEIEQYQLYKDLEILSLMNDLLAKIQNNLCSLISYDYRAAMQKGFLNSDLKDYLNASLQWEKAIEYARQNPICSIDTTLPSNLLLKYSSEIKIQSSNQKCYAFLSSNELDSFLYYYTISYNIHKTNPEKYRLISIPNLVDICKMNSKNEILLIKSIEYLLQNQRIDESYTLFLQLTDVAKTSKINRDLFMRQSKIIASYDLTNKGFGTKTTLYNKRFKGNKVPLYFRIEYLKELY